MQWRWCELSALHTEYDVDVGNGLTLHADRSGHGPALLLLHGFTGSSATWDSLRPALEPHFSVIAVDLPGHGRSGAPADDTRYALHHLADDLAALLDAVGVDRAAVLGYSMGGRAALHFAIAHPERVSALILESATPGIESAHDRGARIDSDFALADMIERDGVESFVHFWERLPIWSSQAALPGDVRQTVHERRLANGPTGLANSLRGAGAGARPSVARQLESLPMPTLLMAGALDPKFVELARVMHEFIPDARTEIVSGAGHTVHLERPTEFIAIVNEFLVSALGSSGGGEWPPSVG